MLTAGPSSPLWGAASRNFARCKKSAGVVKSSFHTAVFPPARSDGVSVPPNASASMPSRTPADLSTGMASGGSGHAKGVQLVGTDRTPEARFSRACREGKPARRRLHLRLDGGH